MTRINVDSFSVRFVYIKINIYIKVSILYLKGSIFLRYIYTTRKTGIGLHLTSLSYAFIFFMHNQTILKCLK